MSTVSSYSVAQVTAIPEISASVVSFANIIHVLTPSVRVAGPAATASVVGVCIPTAAHEPLRAVPTVTTTTPAISPIQATLQALASEVPVVARADIPRLVALAEAAQIAPVGQMQPVDQLAFAVRASYGQVVADQVHAAVSASMQNLGFDRITVLPDQRSIRAADSASSRSLRVDVNCTPDGKVSVAAEPDGCPGDTCQNVMRSFEAELRRRGVRMHNTFTRSKHRNRFARIGSSNRLA